MEAGVRSSDSKSSTRKHYLCSIQKSRVTLKKVFCIKDYLFLHLLFYIYLFVLMWLYIIQKQPQQYSKINVMLLFRIMVNFHEKMKQNFQDYDISMQFTAVNTSKSCLVHSKDKQLQSLQSNVVH